VKVRTIGGDIRMLQAQVAKNIFERMPCSKKKVSRPRLRRPESEKIEAEDK
jgi:hypothetical protein